MYISISHASLDAQARPIGGAGVPHATSRQVTMTAMTKRIRTTSFSAEHDDGTAPEKGGRVQRHVKVLSPLKGGACFGWLRPEDETARAVGAPATPEVVR